MWSPDDNEALGLAYNRDAREDLNSGSINLEQGLMAEAEATALKRILAYQIKQEMELPNISKTALAKMMKTSRSSVDRLLDPKNSSITLLTLVSQR